jgi:starch synthase
MVLISHPTINANVRHAATALEERQLLANLWTTVAESSSSALHMLPKSLRQKFGRRSVPFALHGRVRCAPFREVARHVCGKLGLAWLTRHEKGIFSVDAVYRSLDRRVAREVLTTAGLTGVYCYEDGAAATFGMAQKLGLACIYDLPIGYWRAAQIIYEEERIREPEWSSTLSGLLDSPAKLARKDEELAAADLVLVASSFTRRTLEMAPISGKRIKVIPYGAPDSSDAPVIRARTGKLKALFVGGLSQRKGLSYLLKAVKTLGGHVELTLLGRKTAEHCAPLNVATREHRWIPSAPHKEVLEEIGRHDVLVFPSLFEGFGLVILEAMSRGIPVIATPNTGGPDVIAHGEDGFIVPIRSWETIAKHLEELVQDPEKLLAMKAAASAKAATFTWEKYRAQLGDAVASVLDPGDPIPAHA